MSTSSRDPGGDIAGMLSSDWVSENVDGELSAISLRVPPERLAAIDAMAKKAGISRNRMANMLLSAGIVDVMNRLPSEVMDDLREAMEDEIL